MDILEFIDKKKEFIEYIVTEKKISKNTELSYSLDLGQLISFWQITENKEKAQFNLEEILKKYFNILNNTDIKQSSIARKISCINSFKRFLKKLNINLNFSLKRPYIKLQHPEVLETKDISILLDSIEMYNLPTKFPYRDKAIIELLYATGILCSEIVNIELQHINLNSKTIIIRGKNKRERVVVFGNQALKHLTKYLKHERAEPKNLSEKLFLNFKNKPLTARSIQRICKMFRLCFENNKIITPKILRHSFANHMLENGAEVEKMQQLLGHKIRISTEKYIYKKQKK